MLTDPNHAYISYYVFGGKLVGMRRANQPCSWQQTQTELTVVG